MTLKLATKESYKEILKVMNGVKRDLLLKINELPDSEVYKLRWMRGMIKEIDSVISGKKVRAPDGTLRVKIRPLANRLAEKLPLIQVFKSGVKEGYDQVGIYRKFPLIDKKAIAFLQDYSFDLIKNVTEDMRGQIKSQIRLGVIHGDSVPKIVRRMTGLKPPKGVLTKAKYRAERIVRTELARAHVEGRMHYYRGVGVKKVQVIGKGTDCPICGDYIGNMYDIDDAPRPPFHPNCACDIVAVIAIGKEIIIIGSEIWKEKWYPMVAA